MPGIQVVWKKTLEMQMYMLLLITFCKLKAFIQSTSKVTSLDILLRIPIHQFFSLKYKYKIYRTDFSKCTKALSVVKHYEFA